MPTLSSERLYGREEMLSALLRAGQFAHLDAATLARSLDSLWDYDARARWIESASAGAAWNPAARLALCAERAVSFALVKAARTGLMEPRYYDALTVDWVARTEPSLCCLCCCVGLPMEGGYTVTLDFAAYAVPTFLRVAAAHHLRRPVCSKCSWAVGGRVWREEGRDVSVAVDQTFYGAALAHLPSVRSFRERVQAGSEDFARLRFDPRREPERVEPVTTTPFQNPPPAEAARERSEHSTAVTLSGMNPSPHPLTGETNAR